FFDVFLGGAQRRGGGSVAFVEQVEGVHGGAVDFFGVGQDTLFGFEALIFAGVQLGVFDFAGLEGPQVEQAEAVLLAVFEVFDVGADLFPGSEGGGNAPQLAVSIGVEQGEAGGAVEGKDGFVLGMDGGQMRREFAENGDGGGLIVDEDAA